MASEALLAALEGNYGEGLSLPDDVGTVRGLLAFCRKWTDGRVHPEELEAPCLSMVSRLRLGAKEMEADLNRHPEMVPEMRDPISRTIGAYGLIADILEELPELAKDAEIGDFRESLELFEQERLAVLDAQDELQFQLSGKMKLCPRCGLKGDEEACPRCGLARLYPDPASQRLRFEKAILPGVYGKVFRAYQLVVSGERSVGRLEVSLAPLEEHLEMLLSARKKMERRRADGDVPPSRRKQERALLGILIAADTDIRLALAGIDRMREATVSWKMSDLARGWEDIFHAAKALSEVALQVGRVLGVEPGAADPDSAVSRSTVLVDDLVDLAGES